MVSLGILEAFEEHLKTAYVKLDGDSLCIFGQMITSYKTCHEPLKFNDLFSLAKGQ